MPYCSLCNITVDRKRWTEHVRSNTHKNNSTVPICDNVEQIKSAFKGRIASYKVVASNEEVRNSPSLFLNNIKNQIKSLINHSLQTHTCIKVNFEFFCTFLLIKDELCEETMKSFCPKNFEDFEERDSGWTFLSTSHIEVNINKYQPLSGSRFINLPKSIQSKKATKKQRTHSFVINSAPSKGLRLLKIEILELNGSQRISDTVQDNNVILSSQYVVKDIEDEIMEQTEKIINNISKKNCF
ncbi:hypothetical protein ABMA28_003608 [Loxostege sticticalis]|uniref:Uncharacterized protein n=1 Tax=Loxostege sticticalis TaxID=481309 RepID=A0ABD0SWL0_LOXSC